MTVQLRLGKGLLEPQPPFRKAWFFGAELNSVSADGWESLPSIDGETNSFDLSSITLNHEVCVALIRINNARGGMTYFKMRWYRARDDKLLFTYDWSYLAVADGWCYAYSYIGWVDWEINENGEYYVVAEVSGANPYSASKYFTISGIEEEEEPEPPPIGTMGWISQRFSDASSFLYSVYLETLSWFYPFWLISSFFYSLSSTCANLSWDFYYFNEWVENVTSKLTTFLTSLDLEAWFLEWKQKILFAWDWVRDAWNNIRSDLENWWTVQVAELTEWWTVQIAELQAIKSAWDNFWTVTFPTLVSFTWLGIWWNSQLIELEAWFHSELQELVPFWEGWQDVKDKVVEFIDDPLEWLLGKFTDWFLGPEE